VSGPAGNDYSAPPDLLAGLRMSAYRNRKGGAREKRRKQEETRERERTKRKDSAGKGG